MRRGPDYLGHFCISEKRNPHQVSGAAPNYKVGGGAMMAFGLVIASLGLLQFYIVRRFKFAAAASGLGDAFRLL